MGFSAPTPPTIGNGYVYAAWITDDYLQQLILRNNFTDVTTPEQQSWGEYHIQDADGNVTTCSDKVSTRNWLINQYILIYFS